MDSNFNLDLAHTSDAEVISEGTTFVGKIHDGVYFNTISTTSLEAAIALLITKVGKKGGGKTTTEEAAIQRVTVDYEFNMVVNIIDGIIDNPAVMESTKQLMRDETGLVQAKTGKRGKDAFRFMQAIAGAPAYLGAQGIPGGGGINQWKLALASDGKYDILDPTVVANILLTTITAKTDYLAMHRHFTKGVWSAWEGPLSFTTL